MARHIFNVMARRAVEQIKTFRDGQRNSRATIGADNEEEDENRIQSKDVKTTIAPGTTGGTDAPIYLEGLKCGRRLTNGAVSRNNSCLRPSTSLPTGTSYTLPSAIAHPLLGQRHPFSKVSHGATLHRWDSIEIYACGGATSATVVPITSAMHRDIWDGDHRFPACAMNSGMRFPYAPNTPGPLHDSGRGHTIWVRALQAPVVLYRARDAYREWPTRRYESALRAVPQGRAAFVEWSGRHRACRTGHGQFQANFEANRFRMARFVCAPEWRKAAVNAAQSREDGTVESYKKVGKAPTAGTDPCLSEAGDQAKGGPRLIGLPTYWLQNHKPRSVGWRLELALRVDFQEALEGRKVGIAQRRG
ncbi:hypothetical protein DFH07DRAFT_770529 [Mycena maculata]|uniref:Uncharacterized protein n=1 Tax=Mycena maculata TaxID=230809 RepID=A0AAD7NKC4_9AGAR|nr:hypothetical protein DFH07DRAFT_770529 [Mycena maculata]